MRRSSTKVTVHDTGQNCCSLLGVVNFVQDKSIFLCFSSPFGGPSTLVIYLNWSVEAGDWRLYFLGGVISYGNRFSIKMKRYIGR